MTNTPRVTVWNEYQHEKTDPEVAKIYPNGIHCAIAQHLLSEGLSVQTATLEQPDHGLTDPKVNAYRALPASHSTVP